MPRARRSRKPRKSINEILPPEILGHIFELGTADEQVTREDILDAFPAFEYLPKDVQMYILMPCNMTASRICRLWREVAISRPSLWSNIQVHDGTSLDEISTRLDRAKATPLDIEITLKRPAPCQLGDVLDQPAPHVHQWRSFKALIRRDAIDITELLDDVDAPLLETFELRDLEGERPDASMTYHDAILPLFNGPDSVPRLVSVCLGSVPVVWDLHPFKNLRHLEISYITYEAKPSLTSFTDILSQSRTLETLSLAGHPATMAELLEAAPKRVHLPFLNSLELASITSPNVLLNILPIIDAPNLAHLGLTEMFAEVLPEVDFGPVLATIGVEGGPLESMKSLQSLVVAHYAAESNLTALDGLLCRLTDLRTLEIVMTVHPGRMDDDTFKARSLHWLSAFMSAEDRKMCKLPALPVNIPCPNLEELKTSGPHIAIVLRVAKARKEIGAPLRRVTFDERDVQELSQKQGRAFEKLGVELAVYRRPKNDLSMPADTDSEAEESGDDEDEGGWADGEL